MTNKKFFILAICIVMDLIGMATYAIPGIAEIADVAWAPFSSFVLYMLFRGSIGRLGAVVNFVEEAMPGLDFIPTFTLAWLWKYVVMANRNNITDAEVGHTVITEKASR
jgi:hypothetical protein